VLEFNPVGGIGVGLTIQADLVIKKAEISLKHLFQINFSLMSYASYISYLSDGRCQPGHHDGRQRSRLGRAALAGPR